MFQSLAGTDATLIEEFDVTVDLLDKAYRTMEAQGPLRDIADNWMYFETGQGSEISYNKHDGIDMATCEALCYGLGRRYRPMMLNNVTGFIGPETHLDNFEMIYSNLQDHFMGKLLGLPMDMAPCFTLHSQVTTEGQQMAIELLTAAGSNYYMDVYLNTDRMLAYFDTSGHDDQTMREIYDLRPAPEYLRWAISRGIFIEREAIYAELRPAEIGNIAVRILPTAAPGKAEHLNDPELGSRISDEALRQLGAEGMDVQIVISDGLSAEAIHHNVHDLLPVVLDGLKANSLKVGQPIIAPYGRVKLAESVGEALQPQLVLLLIGERPGGDALASRSMSAYLYYRLGNASTQQAAAQFSGNPEIRYEYTEISNIYAGGLPAVEAGGVIVEKALESLKLQAEEVT